MKIAQAKTTFDKKFKKAAFLGALDNVENYIIIQVIILQ